MLAPGGVRLSLAGGPARRAPTQCSIYCRTVEFEWDPKKNLLNQQKHRLSFEEASTVFGDPLALTVPDPRHSEREFRYLTTGYTNSNRLVIVAHADIDDELVRIIAARNVEPSERRAYESGT